MNNKQRSENEILHGKFLAREGAELTWGWGSPAGKIRAARRGNLISTGAQLNSNTIVLEIGCGTGLFTEIFAHSGCHITAIDISEDLLEIANQRNLPVERVNFLNRSFEECNKLGPFDAIIGSSILHHLDPNDSFQRIFKLLKPQGIMSFAEPNMLNPQIFIERKFRHFFPSVSPDETAFIRWKLQRELKSIGFIHIEIIPYDWLHPAIPESIINYVSTTGKVIERIPIIRELSRSLNIKATRP
jgi:2-polyprenyl-3-methyl-5-hydroxy-6-metoxy-1,4-benzoquinol methylase